MDEVELKAHTLDPNVMGEDDLSHPIGSESSGTSSRSSLDKDAGGLACRVCQCAESDKRGDAALGFLGINPPLRGAGFSNGVAGRECGVVEFIGPGGEVFMCKNDIETGSGNQRDTLIDLGCSCKSDLALVHYACALKWFVNHGSTHCEICGHVAKNIDIADLKKVIVSLKEYEALRERTASGDPNPSQVQNSASVDPDAVAAIRRQRLSEISLFFSPHGNPIANSSSAVLHNISEQTMATIAEDVVSAENPATKWAVEGTGILLAVGLLTVTLAWLIAPRVGKKTAKSGLHILLAGVCALTVVIFFRFVVLTRIKYGPARYWAILFVFWFLVFGIWASRTHGAHTT